MKAMKQTELIEQFSNPDLEELRIEMLKAAVVYSRIRADWYFLTQEERRERDASRTRTHNAFIDCCNILARSQRKAGVDPVWRNVLGDDRKVIGDFACELHAALGVRMR